MRMSTKYHISIKKISAACCDPAPDFYCSFGTTSFTYGGKNEFPVQTHWAPHIHTSSDTLHLNEVECLALLKAPVWHDRALVSAEDYGVRKINTQTGAQKQMGALSFLQPNTGCSLLLLICYWPGRGRGRSGAKVIRPKRSSCLGGVGPAAVNATLLPPLSLIKNEWWAVWVKGVNGSVSVQGGYREGLCGWAAGHATDCCIQPRGRNQESNKAGQQSLKEINLCAQEAINASLIKKKEKNIRRLCWVRGSHTREEVWIKSQIALLWRQNGPLVRTVRQCVVKAFRL